jgi:diguanylate cyclase (GGDEF)-like protein/PAS domain S-box-containing protein
MTHRSLFDQAPCGLLVADADGVITAVNQTMLAWTGLRREDVVGRSFRDLLDSGSRIFHETRYLPVLALAGEVREVALGMSRADGSVLSVLVNSRVVEDGVRIAVFDSTSRHGYERELLAAQRQAESSEKRVRALQDASTAFGACTSEDELAEALVASARSAFSAAAASVSLLDGAGVMMPIAGGPAMELPSDASFAVSDLAEARPQLAASLRSARYESFSVVPLVEDGGSPLGSLQCFFARRRTFDEHDRELQFALARQAAQVLARIRLQRELENLALHDPLTGLANRLLIRERLTQGIAASARSGSAMAVIFLDLDGFKAVNDNLGHGVGDEVLKTVADRLRRVVRLGDVLGRFGGDEFVVICEDAGDSAARHIASRIARAIREPFDGVTYPVTASIGVAVRLPSPGSGNDAVELLGMADAAMYASKNAGKDRVTVVVA